jgi:hypothetical protein
MFQPTGYDFYNALQIRLQKRYSEQVVLPGAYTLSKTWALAGVILLEIFLAAGEARIDTFNRKLEKSIENIDQTHVFVLS